MRSQALEQKLSTLPARPGCYIYRDSAGAILYVGKAVNLRNRVRSYFQRSANHGPKVRRLVANVADLDLMVTDSELEALILECSLIKQHRPPYNVRLRDDKQYPYLCLTMSEPYPRLLFVRRVRRDGNRYFGPYPSSKAVRGTMELIKRIFPLVSCGKRFSGENVQKPCLYYHIGQCLAPCAGLAPQGEYRQAAEDVADFLEGRQEQIIARLRRDMEDAAENLQFERAGRLRDRVNAVEEVLQRQKVITSSMVDQDVIAVVENEQGSGGACVQMFYIRGGKLIGQNHFMVEGTEEEARADTVQQFVQQYYESAAFIPQEILLPCDIAEMDIVQSWLRTRKGRKVEISVPRRGEKLRLVEMATRNATQALEQINAAMAARLANTGRALTELSETLHLPGRPARIECYDISNTQGANQVASMVVCVDGAMAKGEYRRFRIRRDDDAPNDFASMKEVVMRRLIEARNGNPKFLPLPDLLIVDGGRGQVSSAGEAMDESGVQVPLAGLAKQYEHLFVRGSAEPAILPRNSQALYLVQRIRDEAHRFANTYQAAVRSGRQTRSVLDDVPGIGPKRRRALQVHFGSLKRLRAADTAEIAAAPGMSAALAEAVYERLHSADAA